jgi:hydrocephalus-inducing protein
MPEVLETISVESPVRQTARYIITVENPLTPDIPVAMGSLAKPADWWSCDSPYVKLNELSPLSGNNEGTFEVEYRPLKPTAQPTEHLLTIITKELGTCKYKLIVKASPPLLKQVLRFDAPLGSMQSESFIFRAYNTANCSFACSVKKPDSFTVQTPLAVPAVAGGWDGEDARLNVVFEPTVIGEVRDTLLVTSPEGGEYLCELIGNCTAPMPQGPFNLVQGGGAVDIPFRNCFSSQSTWTFSVDSSAYRIAAPAGTASVNAKTQSQCSVVFEPKEEHLNTPGGIVSAKLFITCTSIPNIPPWIFYLQGKIDPNAGAAPAGKKK